MPDPAGAGAGPGAGRAPAPPPWLTEPALALAQSILAGHQRGFGRPLLAGPGADASRLQWAQALFAAPLVVLAHDGQEPGGDPGPRLTYANRAALRLWRRRWDDMVAMPSRLTAPAGERGSRGQALRRALSGGALEGYSGIRIDSGGRRFRISGARLWSLLDGQGRPCGQAAGFSSWWWL